MSLAVSEVATYKVDCGWWVVSAPAGGERGRRAPKGSSALAPDERGADLDMAKSDEAQPGHPSKGGRSGPGAMCAADWFISDF